VRFGVPGPLGSIVESRDPRRASRTPEFNRWLASLNPERRAKVVAAVDLVTARGSTLGRPHVDVIHAARMHKLKELRIDRGARVLFAFDSNRHPVMLLGGDKTGKWNRWYPTMIDQAQRLYADHERRLGKEPPWWNRDMGRDDPPRSR
jgi:hypothetical protein